MATPVDATRPAVPAEIEERFVCVDHPVTGDERLVYRPALWASATLHYVSARAKVDDWQDVWLLAPLGETGRSSPWTEASEHSSSLRLQSEPASHATFATLPPAASNRKSYPRWSKMLASHLLRNRPLRLWRCLRPRLVSSPRESEADFRVRLREALRATRDLQVEKLRRKYSPKLQRLQDRIRRAEQRVEVERSQYSQHKAQAAISFGATVVGALFGRKLGSLGNLGRATTAMRGAGRAARERGDIGRAHDRVETLREQLAQFETQFEDDLERAQAALEPAALKVTPVSIACRKSDLEVRSLTLVWTPWRVGAAGIAKPAFEEPLPI